MDARFATNPICADYLTEVSYMKQNIHPAYGKAIVRCVCGETFETGSTRKETVSP